MRERWTALTKSIPDYQLAPPLTSAPGRPSGSQELFVDPLSPSSLVFSCFPWNGGVGGGDFSLEFRSDLRCRRDCNVLAMAPDSRRDCIWLTCEPMLEEEGKC